MYKVVKHPKDIIIEKLEVGNPIIWKGNTPLLAEEHLFFGGQPAVHLQLLLTQTVCNRFTKGVEKYYKIKKLIR